MRVSSFGFFQAADVQNVIEELANGVTLLATRNLSSTLPLFPSALPSEKKKNPQMVCVNKNPSANPLYMLHTSQGYLTPLPTPSFLYIIHSPWFSTFFSRLPPISDGFSWVSSQGSFPLMLVLPHSSAPGLACLLNLPRTSSSTQVG